MQVVNDPFHRLEHVAFGVCGLAERDNLRVAHGTPKIGKVCVGIGWTPGGCAGIHGDRDRKQTDKRRDEARQEHPSGYARQA